MYAYMSVRCGAMMSISLLYVYIRLLTALNFRTNRIEFAILGGLKAYESEVCPFAELASSWDMGTVLNF